CYRDWSSDVCSSDLLVMDAVVGYDPRDPGSANRPVPSYFASLTTGIAGMRVALLEREVQVSTHPEVREAVEAAARVLEGLGAHRSEGRRVGRAGGAW